MVAANASTPLRIRNAGHPAHLNLFETPASQTTQGMKYAGWKSRTACLPVDEQPWGAVFTKGQSAKELVRMQAVRLVGQCHVKKSGQLKSAARQLQRGRIGLELAA